MSTDSGPLQIDFKGAAEVVKEVKQFILDVWSKIRSQPVENISANNKEIRDSLDTIVLIGQLEKNGKLEREKAEILRNCLFENAVGLLKNGARIPEITPEDTIDNVKLLAGMQQKLLPYYPDQPEIGKRIESTKKKKTRERKHTTESS